MRLGVNTDFYNDSPSNSNPSKKRFTPESYENFKGRVSNKTFKKMFELYSKNAMGSEPKFKKRKKTLPRLNLSNHGIIPNRRRGNKFEDSEDHLDSIQESKKFDSGQFLEERNLTLKPKIAINSPKVPFNSAKKDSFIGTDSRMYRSNILDTKKSPDKNKFS